VYFNNPSRLLLFQYCICLGGLPHSKSELPPPCATNCRLLLPDPSLFIFCLQSGSPAKQLPSLTNLRHLILDSNFTMPSSNCSSLEYARTLSNKSCCLIKQRHYDEAIANLMAALKETKKTAIKLKPEEADSAETSSQSKLGSCRGAASSPCSDDHQNEFEHICSSEGNSYLVCPSRPYVYQTPVFMHERKGDEALPIAQFTFHIMFNLALAHHLKALQGDEKDQSKALPVSKRLYELTFQMQAQEPQSNLVLMAALLNNLSLVHKDLNNQHEAEQCQQLLLSALLLVVDMGGAGRVVVETGSSSQTDLEGFMGNVVHLIIAESPVASAA
jgi:hypothetical protein